MTRIEHYDGLNRTPALRLALKAQLEIIELGRSELMLNVFWDHQAIVAFVEEPTAAIRPVGVLTWKQDQWAKQIAIALGYVEPEYRGQGIYRTLWDALIHKAQALDLRHIVSGTHVDNVEMRRVAVSQGRREFGVYLGYDVPPASQP